jgi:hypothetical protein
MLKHRGFPGRLSGTDFQFVIRRANKDGATPLIARKRYPDRSRVDCRADEAFMAALWAQFGEEPFERGNLDAGRLSWLFGREVVPASSDFNPRDYEALLRIDVAVARRSYPDVFADAEPDAVAEDWDDDEDEDDADWDADDEDGEDEDDDAPAPPRGR